SYDLVNTFLNCSSNKIVVNLLDRTGVYGSILIGDFLHPSTQSKFKKPGYSTKIELPTATISFHRDKSTVIFQPFYSSVSSMKLRCFANSFEFRFNETVVIDVSGCSHKYAIHFVDTGIL